MLRPGQVARSASRLPAPQGGLDMTRQRRRTVGLLLAAVLTAGAPGAAQAAWEPTKPIEFIVPAGTGGGADQMARLVSGLAEKHKLSPKPLIVVNKTGGGGGGGVFSA